MIEERAMPNAPLPLLLVPGLLNDARVWKNQTDALSGERDVRVAESTTHDSVAALAAEALARAPAARFALAGFSLGGYVALEILRQAPERVAALALIDTGSRPDTVEATQVRRGMLDALDSATAGFDAVAATFLPRVVHPDRVDDALLADLLLSMARSVGAAAFARQQNAAIARPDSRPGLGAIRCPTMVLCGRQDTVTPLALSEEMASSIPDAKLVVLEACGHMSLLERPREVVDAMRAWLQAADRARPAHD